MDVEIINVRIPREIADWLDFLVKKGIYKSRSEAIREFARDYVTRHKARSVSDE